MQSSQLQETRVEKGVFGPDRFNGLTDWASCIKQIGFKTHYKIISIWILK